MSGPDRPTNTNVNVSMNHPPKKCGIKEKSATRLERMEDKPNIRKRFLWCSIRGVLLARNLKSASLSSQYNN